MDTVTQAALGACIAQAGFSERLGRKALVVGTVCGLLPDFDVLLSVGSDHFTYLQTHRGWSHSLLVLPIIALFIAWLAMKWATRPKAQLATPVPSHINNFGVWYLLCFLTLITHPLLDLFTTYGTQIFTPLSNARYTLDGVSIIDPIYTVPLLIAIIIGLIRKKPIKDRKWAVTALVFSSAYLGFGLTNSLEAKKQANMQLTQHNFQAVDLRSSPTMFNTLLWRIVAKDKDGHFAVGFFSTVTKKPIEFTFYKNSENELINQALNSEQGKILRWFSTDLLRAELSESENGHKQVILTDMRFGLVTNPVSSFFIGVFEFDNNKKLLEISSTKADQDPIEPDKELKSIWSMIWPDS